MSLSIPHRLSIPHFTPQLLLARLSAHSTLTHFAALASFMPPKEEAENSAAQPALLPLRELNKRSAQFGGWTVVVRQAQVEECEYQWEGQKRTGKTFSCLFVSPKDPGEYCIGQMRFIKKSENIFHIWCLLLRYLHITFLTCNICSRSVPWMTLLTFYVVSVMCRYWAVRVFIECHPSTLTGLVVFKRTVVHMKLKT